MIRINIVVEGQSEETFVREILYDYLSNQKIFITARSIGGVTKHSYSKIKREIINWCKRDSKAFVTSLLDVYALPNDFPGLDESKKVSNIYSKVNLLETKFGKDIDRDNFIPYLQLHEFESLLFSNVDAFKELGLPHLIPKLHEIRKSVDSPEHINDDPETAPSKRILQLFKNYQKPLHGSLISIEIGIDKMRKECKHFDGWISKLEALNKISETELA